MARSARPVPGLVTEVRDLAGRVPRVSDFIADNLRVAATGRSAVVVKPCAFLVLRSFGWARFRSVRPKRQGSFSGTWFRRYRRTEMELGRRVSFPRGFQGGRASRNTLRMGWSWGYVATVAERGRTIFVADAHRDDGKRFGVHADEKLTDCDPNGIRTRVTAVKGRCPGPLDDRVTKRDQYQNC
jgi:hypothetical protein